MHSALWHCKTIASINLGRTAEMTLIGFDGIAYPSIVFSHHPSLFHFLEHLENSLLPQGCLLPPLWYIKAQVGR